MKVVSHRQISGRTPLGYPRLSLSSCWTMGYNWLRGRHYCSGALVVLTPSKPNVEAVPEAPATKKLWS